MGAHPLPTSTTTGTVTATATEQDEAAGFPVPSSAGSAGGSDCGGRTQEDIDEEELEPHLGLSVLDCDCVGEN